MRIAASPPREASEGRIVAPRAYSSGTVAMFWHVLPSDGEIALHGARTRAWRARFRMRARRSRRDSAGS